MKIAEALTESKRLANLIPTLVHQFNDNAIIVNGVKPEQDPVKLFGQVKAAIDAKAALDKRVAYTNSQIKLGCGLTIHEAIIRKAQLKSTYATLFAMLNQMRSNKRASDHENDVIKTYGVKPDMIEAQANEAAKELRLIESQMQQANWVEELR